MYKRLLLTMIVPVAVAACGGHSASSAGAVSHPSGIALASPMVLTQRLSSEHGSSAAGTATVTSSPTSFTIRLQVAGLQPATTHPSSIHAGTCGSSGAVVYPLEVLTADHTGDAVATTVIHHAYNVAPRGWDVSVLQGPTMTGTGDTPIACADLASR